MTILKKMKNINYEFTPVANSLFKLGAIKFTLMSGIIYLDRKYNKNDYFFCTYQDLANLTGISMRSIKTHINELEKLGYIKKQRTPNKMRIWVEYNKFNENEDIINSQITNIEEKEIEVQEVIVEENKEIQLQYNEVFKENKTEIIDLNVEDIQEVEPDNAPIEQKEDAFMNEDILYEQLEYCRLTTNEKNKETQYELAKQLKNNLQQYNWKFKNIDIKDKYNNIISQYNNIIKVA